MDIDAYYKIDVLDKDGELIYEGEKTPSESFVVQFLKHMRLFMVNSNTSIRDTGNVPRNIYPVTEQSNYGSTKMAVNAPSNNSSYGIVVGQGGISTGLSSSNYQLGAQIPHGYTGGVYLAHGAMSFASSVYVRTAPTSHISFQMDRSFYNASGAPISIDETGIYCMTQDIYGGGNYYFCLIRDTFTPSVDIGVEQIVAIQYFVETWM